MKRQSKVIANFAPLQEMTADVEANKNAKARVGVLANKADRFSIMTSTSTKDKMNNPTLGLVHEFGSASLNIPARSFLRVPLELELPKKLAPLGKQVWKVLISTKGFIHALEVLGLMGVQVVEVAFRTGGYGRWQALKASTIRRKGSSAILIDSGQLRRSISMAVVKP